MGNLVLATVSIQGTRPLLFHAFNPEALPLEKQEQTGVAGNCPDEWRQTVLMTESRQLYLPGTYLFGCLRNAATFLKRGRTNLQKALSSTLQVLDDCILIHDRFLPSQPTQVQQGQLLTDLPPVFILVAGVRNPTTKARNVRYRVATIAGWQCQFQLLWDKTVISRQEMQAMCIDAGRLVGLADGRAIGYGRFEVLSYECTDTS